MVLIMGTWASWTLVTMGGGTPAEQTNGNENGNSGPGRAVLDKPVIQEMALDGTLQWTLYLERVIRDEDNVRELSNPRVIYKFRDSGEELVIQGSRGVYDENNRILTMTDQVSGYSKNETMGFSAQELRWDGNTGVLTTSGSVTLNKDGFRLNGTGLSIDMKEKLNRIEINGGVSAETDSEFLENFEIMSN
jgi:LPS export ABC transporter protein LptC